MSISRPADYVRIVRAHANKTRGFILADRHPCLDIRNREVERVRRDLKPAIAATLNDLQLPPSWLLAIILCPADDTVDVAKWAQRLPARDVDRIRFYSHASVGLTEALAAWVKRGLPPPRVDDVGDWKEFHRRFGLHLNDMAYRDAGRGDRKGPD